VLITNDFHKQNESIKNLLKLDNDFLLELLYSQNIFVALISYITVTAAIVHILSNQQMSK